METQTSQPTQLSAIERALAAAKARKAAREAEGDPTTPTTPPPPRPGLESEVRIVTEDRSAKAAERAERQARILEERRQRTEARTAKKADSPPRSRSTGPVHMKKVESARARLPGLGVVASRIFDEAATVLDSTQLEALAAHLQFHNRRAATTAAPAKPIPVGTQVTIVGGDHRFVGQVGTVTKSQKLRSFVSVAGMKKDLYTFTAHLSPVES